MGKRGCFKTFEIGIDHAIDHLDYPGAGNKRGFPLNPVTCEALTKTNLFRQRSHNIPSEFEANSRVSKSLYQGILGDLFQSINPKSVLLCYVLDILHNLVLRSDLFQFL